MWEPLKEKESGKGDKNAVAVVKRSGEGKGPD